MKVKEISEILDDFLRKDLAMSWDNVGLLLGREDKEVTRILLALELTKEVLEEAIIKKCGMIVVHHPLIFVGLKKVIQDGNNHVYSLIENDIALYAAHTNFDMINNGLNDFLAEKFDAQNISQISEEDGSGALLRLFEVKEQSIEIFIRKIKETLSIETIRAIGNTEKMIRKIGLVTGAGSEYIDKAFENGADVFITGDIKYHQAMDICQQNKTVLDVGHFETEKIFSEAMRSFIEEHIIPLKNISLIASECERAPFRYI